MNNKVLGWILISVVGAAVLGGMTDASDMYYMLLGVAHLVFGTWAAVTLINSKE